MKIAITIAAALLTASTARAQSNLELNSSLQFNFGSPGARSLGMGGAYIGLADDATTAYTNPAGLVNVVTPEVSAELRALRHTSIFPARGHALGPPTGLGVDTVEGVEEGRAHDSVAGLSFASFVYPARSNRWSFALYRHKLADLSASSQTEGIFYSVRDPDNNDGIVRAAPSRSNLRLEIVGYGAAAAYRFGSRLSLGLSAARYSMDMEAESSRYAFSPSGPPSYQTVINTQSQYGRDSAITLTGGALWRPMDRLAIGVIYRQMTSFSLNVTSDKSTRICQGSLTVPDVAGAGASLLLPGEATLTADYKWIRYSQTTRGFVTFDARNRCQDEPSAIEYSVPDVGEAHLGLSKLVYVGNRSLILSAGWWNDPAHGLEHVDPNDTQHVLFNGGRSDNHFSVGVGLNIDELRQIYAAYETSDRQQVVSISTILRF